jgi:hypothetical protein
MMSLKDPKDLRAENLSVASLIRCQSAFDTFVMQNNQIWHCCRNLFESPHQPVEIRDGYRQRVPGEPP